MNILILFTQPWKTGGAETHVEAILKGLNEDKIFLAVNEGSDLKKLNSLKIQYKNLHIIIIQSRGINFLKWRDSIKKLKMLIFKENIDIITAQQRTAGIWAWRLAKATNIKFTVTMHDPWHRAKFKKVYPKIFPQMIVVSNNLAEILKKEYGFKEDNIKLINNGVDFSRFKPREKLLARKELGLANEEKIILHVSRMSSVKGAVSLALIDALKYLARQGVFFRTVIIGEGPFRNKIVEKANEFNQEYGNWIIIKNFVDDIILWYNATDILVGEGRVAIEALACEKPVVAIRNSNNFIGLVKKSNIEYVCSVNFDGKDKIVNDKQMAQEIKLAFKLTDSEIENIAKYVRDNLSINKMIQGYQAIFDKLLNKY